MFRRDVPRVENRRDPGFSTLVQAAIAVDKATANRGGRTPAKSRRDSACRLIAAGPDA